MAIVPFQKVADFISQADGLPYMLDCLKLYGVSGEVVSGAPWALTALAVLIALLSLFNLFLVFFQNYTLQKRMTVYTSLLVIGFLLTLGGFTLYFNGELETREMFFNWWTVVLPVVVIILQAMSFFAIGKKEADAIAESSTFRLRD